MPLLVECVVVGSGAGCDVFGHVCKGVGVPACRRRPQQEE